MKLFLFVIISILAGIFAGEHLHSFLFGLFLSTVAVGCCYFVAFRTSKYPQLAVFLLLCGMLTKLMVTVIGVMWGLAAEVITSPFVFSVSYLFFSIIVTYLCFNYRDKKIVQNFVNSGAKIY